ncbi:MAG: efflux RND transporter periplasmic adaptor subunit [Chthoniobacteraceae bacterium]
MKKIIWSMVVTLLACGVAWWLLHRGSGSAVVPSASAPGDATSASVAHVQTAAVARKAITETLTAYGSVVAQPGKTHSVSVAFETRVRHILVAPGQSVTGGDSLIEVERSPAAQLQLQQAMIAVESARKELKQVGERFNMKLATNQDLGTAQKTASDAESQLASLQKQGVGTDNRIHADVAGIVAKVDVHDGQLAAAGSPLVEIVAEDEIEVKLGVEAEDLPLLTTGQSIVLFPVNDPASGKITGSVRLLTRRVDPATRLVDVYVSLAAGTKLLLGGYVRGEITRTAQNALVVPRSALLPETGGFTLFTVKANHAVKHTVQAGLENEREIQVIAPDLHEGEIVVVVGNYELEDGMPVEIHNAK